MSRTSPLPGWTDGNEGIAQVVFLEAGEIYETSSAAKKGQYHIQGEMTLAKALIGAECTT